MLKDALEFLAGQHKRFAEKERAIVLDKIPTDGRSIVIEHNGTLTDREVPPPLRHYCFDAIADLQQALSHHGLDKVLAWIDGEQVIALIDETDRRETFRVRLRQSATYDFLQQLEEGGALKQDELVRALRRELRESPDATHLLAAVRQIKFRASTEGHSYLQHGNESLGKSVDAEVTGGDAIPELFTVPVTVFANPGEEEQARQVCALDLEIVVSKQTFLVKPLPDELTRLEQAHLASIHERLAAQLGEERVYFGRPNT